MAALSNDDWRSGCKDILAIQNKARCEAKFTDIQFVTKEGSQKKTFSAHKLILACASPVFEAMFYGTLAEKRSIIETDDDPEAFKMLLDYTYGKEQKLTSLVSAWKYFTIGDKYLIPKIQDIAKQYIDSVSLNDDFFWEIIEGNLFMSPLFFEKVNSYLVENASKLITSEKFVHMPEIIIDRILQLDELNISEYDLLVATTKWAYKNISQVDSKHLIKFYKHIRFATLTIDDYFQFIASYPKAIDAESSLAILQHLRNGHNLPKWCSSRKDLRKHVEQQLFYSTTDCRIVTETNPYIRLSSDFFSPSPKIFIKPKKK